MHKQIKIETDRQTNIDRHKTVISRYVRERDRQTEIQSDKDIKRKRELEMERETDRRREIIRINR